MAREKKTQPCPECGGLMRFEKHADVLSYKDKTKTIKTVGWWCVECGEGILAGEGLASHEKAFLEFKAEVDEVLSPAQVADIRRKLGLSQRKASELLGGGPRAFQKYEGGTQAVSAAMSNLLRLLDNEPSRLAEISVAKGVAKARTASPRTTTKKTARGRTPSRNASPKASAARSGRRKKLVSG